LGKISNLKKFIDLLKTKIENWFYGKHINLGEKINNNLIKESMLSNRLEQFDSTNTNSNLSVNFANITVEKTKSCNLPIQTINPVLK